MSDATCTVPGCGKGPVIARGMCRKHYSRWQRLGDPHPELDEPRACPGCGEEFTPKRTDQAYCTQACRDRAGTRRDRGLVVTVSPVRPCAWCEQEFRHTDGRRLYCSDDCGRIGAALREHPATYGITVQDFRRMLLAQGGLCAICRQPQAKHKLILCVDHCHDTGRVRGLLCDNCNRGIGLLGDNPKTVLAAATYLAVA